MATNKTIDRTLCGFIGWLLNATTSLGDRHYQLRLQIDEDVFIAEHVLAIDDAKSVNALPNIGGELILLGARTGKWRDFSDVKDLDRLEPGTLLIYYGNKAAHDRLEEQMNKGRMPAESK